MAAASIVASSITAQTPQRDGRIAVDERHTDNIGAVWNNGYLAKATDDLNALLSSHATSIAAQLNAGEIAANVDQVTTYGSLAVIRLNYSTQAQGLAALRTAYQNATQLQAVMIGDFLSSLTDAQLQNIFSMTAGQVTTLRANKLTPAANTASAIRAAAGQ